MAPSVQKKAIICMLKASVRTAACTNVSFKHAYIKYVAFKYKPVKIREKMSHPEAARSHLD